MNKHTVCAGQTFEAVWSQLVYFIAVYL